MCEGVEDDDDDDDGDDDQGDDDDFINDGDVDYEEDDDGGQVAFPRAGNRRSADVDIGGDRQRHRAAMRVAEVLVDRVMRSCVVRPIVHVGPRGGTYVLSPSGNKQYFGKSGHRK